MKKFIRDRHEEGYTKSKSLSFKAEDWLTDEWTETMKRDPKDALQTGITKERFKEVGTKIS